MVKLLNEKQLYWRVKNQNDCLKYNYSRTDSV